MIKEVLYEKVKNELKSKKCEELNELLFSINQLLMCTLNLNEYSLVQKYIIAKNELKDEETLIYFSEGIKIGLEIGKDLYNKKSD